MIGRGGSRRRRRVVAVAIAGALVLVLAGCRLHTDFTVREAPEAAATFRGLSGDGRYAVVEATGAGATVPGAGLWRVDRQSGATVALSGSFVRISADGSRVLTSTGLWDDGTLTASTGVLSDDLTHRVALVGGVVTVQSVDGGPATNVETGHPRPAGTTSATPVAVSDDGLTVQYQLSRPVGSIDRFVRIGDPTRLDLPSPSSVGSQDQTHVMAAGGTALARTTERYEDVEDPDFGPVRVMTSATVEILAVPSGAVVATADRSYPLDPRRGFGLGRPAISEDGRRAWSNQVQTITDGNQCGWASPTYPRSCVVDNVLLALSAAGLGATSVGGGDLTGFDITADGSLAVTSTTFRPEGAGPGVALAPRITHAERGAWETLSQGAPTTSYDFPICFVTYGQPPPCTVTAHGAGPVLSDDGHVVAARAGIGGGGWYDYVDTVPPAG